MVRKWLKATLYCKGKVMVTIQAVREKTGRPEKNVRVHVVFGGFGRGVSQKYTTDEKGEVHIDSDPGKGKVYVNGQPVYDGDVSGRTVVYF